MLDFLSAADGHSFRPADDRSPSSAHERRGRDAGELREVIATSARQTADQIAVKGGSGYVSTRARTSPSLQSRLCYRSRRYRLCRGCGAFVFRALPSTSGAPVMSARIAAACDRVVSPIPSPDDICLSCMREIRDRAGCSFASSAPRSCRLPLQQWPWMPKREPALWMFRRKG